MRRVYLPSVKRQGRDRVIMLLSHKQAEGILMAGGSTNKRHGWESQVD